MADFQFNFYAQVAHQPDNDLYQVVTNGGEWSGTISDNDSGGSQFSAGETISITTIGSVAFVGIVNIDNEIVYSHDSSDAESVLSFWRSFKPRKLDTV